MLTRLQEFSVDRFLQFTSNPIDTRDLVTVFGRERIVFESYPFFHNAFSLIERTAWEKCQFDEKHNGIEDRIWARQQALSGRKIIYEPESVVYHEHGLNQELLSTELTGFVTT